MRLWRKVWSATTLRSFTEQVVVSRRSSCNSLNRPSSWTWTNRPTFKNRFSSYRLWQPATQCSRTLTELRSLFSRGSTTRNSNPWIKPMTQLSNSWTNYKRPTTSPINTLWTLQWPSKWTILGTSMRMCTGRWSGKRASATWGRSCGRGSGSFCIPSTGGRMSSPSLSSFWRGSGSKWTPSQKTVTTPVDRAPRERSSQIWAILTIVFALSNAFLNASCVTRDTVTYSKPLI